MLIVDSGPLLAAADAKDPNYAASRELLSSADAPLVVPMLVVAEVAYMLGRWLGEHAERALAQSLAEGEFIPEPVEVPDWTRIHELVDQYADLRLGITDASVMATCERLGETKLATLDSRHFSAIRPRHCAALELLPA